ncbi:MAG: ABC transporter substrate-binding protein [Pseudomonadota bacterium]
MIRAPQRILSVILGAAILLSGACVGDPPADLLRIGIPEEPRTLNIWLASDANSGKVLGLIYQPLYRLEPRQMTLVPWLAADQPVFDATANSYTVSLRPAAWSDGSPVSAEDIVFTANLIKDFKIPRFLSDWRLVKQVTAIDAHTVRFTLKDNTPTFMTRTLTSPIVSRREWTPVAEAARASEKPLAYFLNHRVESPLGSGPFVLKEWRQGTYLHLAANPHFFGHGLTISGYPLGPFIGGILLKIYGTADVAILALKKGAIDMLWWNIQPGYLSDLKDNDALELLVNEKSALYFMGFNLRRPPFNDVALRKAVALLIDRNFIVDRILQGQGEKLVTVVPPGNAFWHNPTLSAPGADLLSREDRIRMAHGILSAAGYTWETPPVGSSGAIQLPSTILTPAGTTMDDVTILTPPADYDPHRAMAGMMIQEWMRSLGIPVMARPMAFTAMLQTVKANHDFDAFVLGYGRLNLDPSYVRTFFHSTNDKPRGWNMSGYHNPVFDRLADASIKEMDRNLRREILWEMQRIVGEDLPYIPLYNPTVVEGVRKDRFSGWVPMIEGVGNMWSFCTLKPTPGKKG